MSGQIKPKETPRQDEPDEFRILVRSCIETYKELPNDAMCLDYNRVSGKLRALVLDDEEYKRETRNIYANQLLRELRELDSLSKLSAVEDEDNDDPRARWNGKKSRGTDKDALNMRFKAAQMRRELIASLNADNASSERDAVNMLFVGMTREEIEKGISHEIFGGSSDGALDSLAGPKEEAPEGTGGKLRAKGQDGPLEDGDFFDTLPDGEIVER
jgi:hypothetical protein